MERAHSPHGADFLSAHPWQWRAGLTGACPCVVAHHVAQQMRISQPAPTQDLSPADRRELAAESLHKLPVVANNPARTQLIAELHQRLLSKQTVEDAADALTDNGDVPATVHSDVPSTTAPPVQPHTPPVQPHTHTVPVQPHQHPSSEERLLTLLAGALCAIIVAIVLRKCMLGFDLLANSSSPHTSL